MIAETTSPRGANTTRYGLAVSMLLPSSGLLEATAYTLDKHSQVYE